VRFAGRLVLGTILVLLFAILTLVWVTQRGLRADLEREIARSLENEARLVAEVLPADSSAWQEAAGRHAATSGHRITLIGRDGRVVAETGLPAGSREHLENHANRPEVAAALTGGVGTDVRTSASVGRPLLYVAVPGGPGVVRVATSLAQVDDAVRRAQRVVLSAALLALLVGSALALLAARSVAGPLTGISAAAHAIASGQPPRFPRSGIPDIDALVQALRQMHQQLGDRFAALQREQAESAALVESMTEGVLAADARGRILTANAAARDALGYAHDAAMPDLRALFRSKAAREVVDVILAGAAVRDREAELDGRILLLSGQPLPHGGAVVVLHDLTELRRLETVRKDFVANVSHELKTPLTSISGYAETLLAETPEEPTRTQFLETIASNARRMQRLVDDLLDLSRIESGRWQPRPAEVGVRAAAEEAWAGLARRRSGRDLRFEARAAAGAEMVVMDPDALRQVLTNLLDNAIRYTPDGGVIRVTAGPADGGVVLAVQDSGQGIAPDHLTRIFERFYRVDPSRSREEGGTGLGLSIVKHIVEAHGGRVDAESELGAGTTVTAWLPRASSTRDPGVTEP
jgi:two-component system phosphate regulon sensor histidine kinase PhoR